MQYFIGGIQLFFSKYVVNKDLHTLFTSTLLMMVKELMYNKDLYTLSLGGGPRVVVSTAAFHARVRGSVPGLGGFKETKNVSSPSTCESQYCGEPP